MFNRPHMWGKNDSSLVLSRQRGTKLSAQATGVTSTTVQTPWRPSIFRAVAGEGGTDDAQSCEPNNEATRSKNCSLTGLSRHSARLIGRERRKSSSKIALCCAANPASTMFSVASSLSRNDRLSKLVEPTETNNPSTIITLQWYIVGWYSAITAPAANNGPERAREARRTVSLSMCGPGTAIRSLTRASKPPTAR